MDENEPLNSVTNLNFTSFQKRDMTSFVSTTENWYDLYYEIYDETDMTYTASAVDVISLALCMLGITANTVSIYIITRIHKKLSMHLKLIISLSCSDCLILIPTSLSKILTMAQRLNFCVNVSVRLLTDLALLATLLNLLAIAVDHFLAIIKPLMHKKEMTGIRGLCVVLLIWLVCALAIVIEVIMGVAHQREKEPLCEAIAFDKTNSELGIVIFIFVVLLVIFIIYGRIYFCVVRNSSINRRTRHQHRNSRHVKTLVTTSLFVITFVLFWTPIGIYNIYIYHKDVMYIVRNLEDITQNGEILCTILLLNAIADPIIYTFRLRQIRRNCFIFNIKPRRQSVILIRSYQHLRM